MPNPSVLQSEINYSPEMKDMTFDISKRLTEACGDVLEDFLGRYEPITYDAEFETVRFEPESGFMPFTDGGLHTLVIYRADRDSAYCPAVFDDYMEQLRVYCMEDFYHDQVGERPESDEEREAYFDKLLDADTGLPEDIELYGEYEDEYFAEACPGLEIKILFYAENNPRNDKKHDAICVSIQTNTDAPYYRDGAGQSIYEEWFNIDSKTPSVVSLHLQNALNEI